MKFTRRCDGAPEKQEPAQASGSKPVLVYIMVLFIVAFLLMALSLAMHLRSNQANMDELKDSVQALENAQATQGQVMDLEKQLSALQEENKELQRDNDEAQEGRIAEQAERDSLHMQVTALQKLNQLLQYYGAGDYEGCYPLLNDLSRGLADSLPKDAPEGLLSPLEQFEAIHDELYDGLAAWLEGHPEGEPD